MKLRLISSSPSPTREQPMADFKSQWRAALTADSSADSLIVARGDDVEQIPLCSFLFNHVIVTTRGRA